MKIKVQREAIKTGKCGIPQKCMIAVAIRKADPAVSYVAVHTNGITVTRKLKSGVAIRTHYAVPLHAAKAIVKFDKPGQKVNPFSFEAKMIDQQVVKERSPEVKEKDKERLRKKRASSPAYKAKRYHSSNKRLAGV